MLIVTSDSEFVGHIEFFNPVLYWDAFELSYQLYGDGFAGRGYKTEAVQLLVDYLFATKKQHRIHLVIVPKTLGPRRVLQPRPQPRRAPLFAPADRPAALEALDLLS